LSDHRLVYRVSKPINWLDYDPSYPKDPKSLGDYIRKYRKDNGIITKDLAKMLGVSEDTVRNWERRRIMPSPRYMESLKRICNIPII
jgi:DNA-binding transcriptional regulator YiaG